MPGKIEHPTVLAMHLRTDKRMGGCEHYRFRIPFEEIRRRVPGAYLDWMPIDAARRAAKDGNGVKPTDYDLLLWPRHRPIPYGTVEPESGDETPSLNEVSGMLDAVEEQLGITLDRESHLVDLADILKLKQRIVLEYDDDYFSNSRDLHYDQYELLHKLMAKASAVTVTTTYLRDLYQKFAAGVPVYVLPNVVNWDEWQGHRKWEKWPEDAVVLALTGSPTHEKDWRIMESVLPIALEEHPQAHLLVGAYMPDYLMPLAEKYKDRVHFEEPVPYHQYTEVVAQGDIILCPVIPDDPFNLGKSAIKAIEGLAAGGVPVTSDLFYYNRVTGKNKRGLTVPHGDVDAWCTAIAKLVNDKNYRMRLLRKGRSWVRANRSIDQAWPLWWNAYREIYNRRKR